MSLDVVTEIEINRPSAEVAAYAVDPGNATAWYRNIKAVEWETSPPLAVGSRLRFRAQFLGRTLDYTYQVQEHEPGRRFVMATAEGPFPMRTTYTWEDAGPGTTRMALPSWPEPCAGPTRQTCDGSNRCSSAESGPHHSHSVSIAGSR